MSININDNVNVFAPKDLDQRRGKFSGGVWQAFMDVTEANSSINPIYRAKGLTCFVLLGGVGTEHWYRDGIADTDLIPKINGTSAVTVDNGLTLNSTNIQLGGSLLHNTTITPGGFNLTMNGLTLLNNGSVKLNNYGIGTFPGTATRVLGTDAIGNVIEIEQTAGQIFVTIPTVAGFSTITDANVIGIIVEDVVRGGIFDLYTGTNPADNGLIFTDGSARKWKRQTNVNYVNINWFGAIADNSFDNLAVFNAAKQSALVNLATTRIYVPKTGNNLFYRISDTIQIDTAVDIFGDGIESKIRPDVHKAGIVFQYIVSRGSKMRDISFFGSIAGDPTTWDITANGIVIRDVVYFDNVYAQQFEGNGFYAWNSIPTGNSSNSIFYNCHAFQNRLHGFSFSGPDANNMQIIKGDAVSNGGLGFNDQSFLGNVYDGIHAASNGSPQLGWQRGLVTFGGTVYAAIRSGFSNITPPDAAYWKNIGTAWIAYPLVLPYDAATTYYAVGSWNADGMNAPPGTGQNQRSTFTACYSESDQAPSYIGVRSMAVGGDNGATYQGSASQLLDAENGIMFTLGKIGAGNPNIGLGKNYVTADEGFISMYTSLGMRMLYDSTTRCMIWNPIQFGAGSAGSLKIFDEAATNGSWKNRTNLGSLVAMPKGWMVGLIEDRSLNIQFDFGKTKPTSNLYDIGDIVLSAGNNAYYDAYPDIIGWKKISNTGITETQWTDIHAYCDYVVTTTDATATIFRSDLNGAFLSQYSIELAAVNTATGDAYSLKKIYTFGATVGTNTFPLILKDSTTTYTFQDAALAGISFNYTITGGPPQDTINWQITGLAATNIRWKISIKRIQV